MKSPNVCARQWPPDARAARYGLALASVTAALGLARLFLYFRLPQPFTVFALCAIGMTFWFAGTGPGILAAVLAAIVHADLLDPEAVVTSRHAYELVFLIFAALMTAVTRARRALEASVAERTVALTDANEDSRREIAGRTPAEQRLQQRESIFVDLAERRRADEEREKLRQAQADLAHVSRVTTMAELTASLAHEVNQPIAAAVTDARTCLRWLQREHPNVEEACAAASRVVRDATRAAEIIGRIRLLFARGTAEPEAVDCNEVVREMIVLLRGEIRRFGISVQTDLAADLPPVLGDRVQVQQVMLNLIMNSIEAMKDANGTRELLVRSRTTADTLTISVNDTGVGLPAQHGDQIFDAFFTTKAGGTGMGLSISRSIVESLGGRLWADGGAVRGASFHMTLPAATGGRHAIAR